MRFDAPKFSGVDPESWIFAINEYFSLLNTPTDQRLRIVGFNLEDHKTFKNFETTLSVSRPTTLGDVFSLARITEARFEAIAKKEHNIKEKAYTTLSLPSKEDSPVVKGPLDASEDTLLSLRKPVDEVCGMFAKFSKDKGCVEKVPQDYDVSSATPCLLLILLMLYPFTERYAQPHFLSCLIRQEWDRYKDLLRACPHHGFTELHQLDTFYNALNPADQDYLNAVAGGNLLERRTQDVLTIIKNKSKVRDSRNKLVVSQVKSCDASSNSSSEIAKLTHAVNQQTSADYDVSSAMPCLFIHVIYAISLSLYPFTERYAQPYFFSCLIRQRGVTILVSEPGYETVGSKDLTYEDWMVNTRTDADLSTAVQNALQTLLPRIREEIREEFRT
nr:reverse transcriptase domain-containing protein [Tanacetum cinerariifolium]